MRDFAKFENTPTQQPDSKDQVILDGEKLISECQQLLADYKKKDFIDEEARFHIHNEITRITDQILIEEDENTVKQLAKVIAQINAQNYCNVGNTCRDKIVEMNRKMDWSRWGLDTEKPHVGYANRENDKTDTTARVNLIFKEIFEYYHLDPKLMMSSWRESIFPDTKNDYEKEHGLKPDRQQELVMSNLYGLSYLESYRPGSASVLAKEYGLTNFGRYPESLLEEQYDNRDNKELPYGAVIYARQDYNGSSFQDGQAFDMLNAELGGKYLLRFMEAAGRFSVMRDLASLDERYGQEQKISFAVLYGHGNKNSMSFGDWSEGREGSTITPSDFPDSANWLKKVRKFFTDKATVILLSCLVGEKGGLAEEVTKKLNIKVIASDRCGQLSSINAVEKDNNLTFKVKFLSHRSPLLRKINDSMTERKAREYKP